MENPIIIKDCGSLDKIITQVGDKLIVLLFFTKNNPECRKSRVYFDKHAQLNPTIHFCVIDLDNIQGNSKYLGNVNTLPKFNFYFRGSIIGSLSQNDENEFIGLIQKGQRYVLMQMKGMMPAVTQPAFVPPQPNMIQLASQLHNPALDSLMPTLQQMQYMFQIFQMMQQLGLISAPEIKKDDAIELSNGDKLIPLPGGKYGLIKKT